MVKRIKKEYITTYENDVILNIGVPVLDKNFTSANEQNSILTWNSVLTAPNDGLKNVVYKDRLGSGLTLIEESLKINGIHISQTKYTFTKTEYGFDINFGDINYGDKFDIS